MLTIAIQAGGDSRRMGQDKALMPFLGRLLISRVVERLGPVADEILITTNHAEDFRFLNLPMFTDEVPGRGALGGLYTALRAATHPFVAVVACDMPFASPELIIVERDLLTESGADVVIPSSAEGLEPMHAVYRKQTCLPAIQAALEAGKWKVISWFPEVTVRILTTEETARYDPHRLAFWNLNTLEEFREAERQAKEITS